MLYNVFVRYKGMQDGMKKSIKQFGEQPDWVNKVWKYTEKIHKCGNVKPVWMNMWTYQMNETGYLHKMENSAEDQQKLRGEWRRSFA